MRYVSLCDGIGAAHVAFQPLGFECVGVAEVDKQCNRLIEKKYGYENYGDITNEENKKKIIKQKPELIIGGTPCQSFSTSGNLKGVEDPRGKLIYHFYDIVTRSKPKYFIWENVANAVRIDEGKTFKGFIDAFTARGHCVEWRILDSKYFGVPQRRERVYVVGYFDRKCGRSVLFETGYDFETIKTNGKTGKKTLDQKGNYGYVPQTHETVTTLNTRTQWYTVIEHNNRLRYLCSVELERLQGFTDGYTKDFPKTVRHKMVGNSMTVPVLHWIGQRILKHDA